MPTNSATTEGNTRPASAHDAIAMAALAEFSSGGYHGATIRQIAGDAGVTIGSIYHHFESKQDLLQHIMVRTLDDVLDQTARTLKGAGDDAVDQLVALVTTWISFHADRQQEVLVGSSEIRSLNEAGRQLLIPRRDKQERLFRRVVQHGVRLGAFRTEYPIEATRAIVNMGGSVATWYHPGGELGTRELARRYCRLALATVERSWVQP
jgi:AcrR family transcriptional regulator